MQKPYFYIDVLDEQLDYAMSLVAHSLEAHQVPNVWQQTGHEARTEELRLTGLLGEVVFADAYGLPRPKHAFGAIDGQDFGNDFVINVDGENLHFDLKTMRRKQSILYQNYILNIPAAQLHRIDSLTDCYFHISLHQEGEKYIASFLGFVRKKMILNAMIGQLFLQGTIRKRANQTSFVFHTDTYEIALKDFFAAPITIEIEKMKGFGIRTLMI